MLSDVEDDALLVPVTVRDGVLRAEKLGVEVGEGERNNVRSAEVDTVAHILRLFDGVALCDRLLELLSATVPLNDLVGELEREVDSDTTLIDGGCDVVDDEERELDVAGVDDALIVAKNDAMNE